jgi:holo-[acyl-carrier protein] synthase
MLPSLQAEETVRVGADLVDVGRVGRFATEHRDQLASIWTARELAHGAGRASAAQHLAVRFAAKEALLKALGTGLGPGMSWTEIEVSNDSKGRPMLTLSGQVASWAAAHGMFPADVSLSHTRTTALAVVLVRAPSAAPVTTSHTAQGASCGST